MHFFNILIPLYLLATIASTAPMPDQEAPQKFNFTVYGVIEYMQGIIEIQKELEQKAEEREKEEDLKNGVYNRNGNIKLTFSKESTNIGNIELDEIFKELREACHSQGVCETNRIVLKGQLIGEGRTSNVQNIELTLSPHGAYGTSHHENLLKMLETAVREMAKCEEYTHKTTCSNSMAYCPSRTTTYTRCAVPSFWSVNIQDPEGRKSTAAPSNISTDLEMEIVGNTIFQDTFAKLSEFGGTLNGRLGNGLNLWQFACV